MEEFHNPFITTEEIITDWTRFYESLGIEVDFSDITIPQKKLGFGRLIVLAQGLMPNQLFDLCLKRFDGKCWRWTKDLDGAIVLNDRSSEDGAYAIWVRDRQEADEELKNVSADKLKERNISTETLLERLLHELKYYNETEDHLDRENVTLCAGSRDSDGLVPIVDWHDNQLRVSYCSSDYVNDLFRGRAIAA